MPKDDRKAEEFRREADRPQVGLLREFWEFLKHNKKWWLAPILVMFLLIGLLVVLNGTGALTALYAFF